MRIYLTLASVAFFSTVTPFNAVGSELDIFLRGVDRLIDTAIDHENRRRLRSVEEEQNFFRSLLSENELTSFLVGNIIYGSTIDGDSKWTLHYKNGRAKFTYSSGKTNNVESGILGNRICFIFSKNSTDCRSISYISGGYFWVNPDTKKVSSKILFKSSVNTANSVNQAPSCPPGWERNCAVGVVGTDLVN